MSNPSSNNRGRKAGFDKTEANLAKARLAKFHNKLKGSFALFAQELFKAIGLPKLTPLQILCCQLMEQDKYRKLCIIGYRGFGKTYLSAAFLQASQSSTNFYTKFEATMLQVHLYLSGCVSLFLQL